MTNKVLYLIFDNLATVGGKKAVKFCLEKTVKLA